MRLLIDECLHTSLVHVAQESGYAANHVNFLGLRGVKDWVIMPRILSGEYVFVTNDRADFLRLYAKLSLHPGLIIMVPNIEPKEQAQLFRAALDYIGTRDLTNTVLEISRKANAVHLKEYSGP